MTQPPPDIFYIMNANRGGQSLIAASSTSSSLSATHHSIIGGGNTNMLSMDVPVAPNNNNNKQTQDGRSKFELPANIADDDVVLVDNILNALLSLGTEDSPLCVKYKVKVAANGYILSALLPSVDVFEVDLDDLLFIKSISPSRIDSVCIAKTTTQGSTELIVKILDHKQRIMITRSTSFSATRKRKFNSIV